MPGLTDLIGLAQGAASGAGAANSANAMKGALTFTPVPYKLGDVSAGQTQFLQQGQDLPSVAALLAKANGQDNAAYQQRILATDPSLASGIAAIGQKASDAASGVIAPDVQRNLDRSSAYAALQGGFGGDGQPDNGVPGMAGDQQTVNTDKYRLNLETNVAPQLNKEAFDYSSALSPTNSDVAQTLLTPGALLQRQDANDLYNNQIANQQAQLNAQAKAEKGNIIMGTNTPSAGGGGGSPLGGI